MYPNPTVWQSIVGQFILAHALIVYLSVLPCTLILPKDKYRVYMQVAVTHPPKTALARHNNHLCIVCNIPMNLHTPAYNGDKKKRNAVLVVDTSF